MQVTWWSPACFISSPVIHPLDFLSILHYCLLLSLFLSFSQSVNRSIILHSFIHSVIHSSPQLSILSFSSLILARGTYALSPPCLDSHHLFSTCRHTYHGAKRLACLSCVSTIVCPATLVPFSFPPVSISLTSLRPSSAHALLIPSPILSNPSLRVALYYYPPANLPIKDPKYNPSQRFYSPAHCSKPVRFAIATSPGWPDGVEIWGR